MKTFLKSSHKRALARWPGNHLAIFLLTMVLLSCSAVSQEEQSDLESRIERVENGLMKSLQFKGEELKTFNIEKRLEELGIPGISIAFASDGKIEWTRAYGMADKREKRAMTTETMLLAGSISKPVTAIRGIQLVEEGKVDMDGNINDYLTSWKVPNNEFTKKEKVTLRRILNHTAGLSVWAFPGYRRGSYAPNTVDVLNGSGNTAPVRVIQEPGSAWQYSGGGYTVLQLLVSDIDQKPFAESLKENVLTPLGMANSTFENPLPEKYHGQAATGHLKNGYEVSGKWPVYPEMAAAGLWTTPSELIQYAIKIQEIYTGEKDGIITYESTKEMLTPGLKGHGLGPRIEGSTFGHGGDDQGFKAQLTAWKDGSHAVVIMVNSDNASIIEEVILSIANEYNLTDVAPNIVEIANLSESQLKKYVGSYQVSDIGTVQIKMANKQLTLNAPFLNPPIQLVAESDTVFYDKAEGTRIVFSFEGNQAKKFVLEGLLTANRIN